LWNRGGCARIKLIDYSCIDCLIEFTLRQCREQPQETGCNHDISSDTLLALLHPRPVFRWCINSTAIFQMACVEADLYCDDPAESFPPAAAIEVRLVQYLFARVRMDPCVERLAPKLSPDMVLKVENEAHAGHRTDA
jgi:hypothetical protein